MRLVAFVVGSLALTLLLGCGETLPPGRNPALEDGSIARASIAPGQSCGSSAELISLPEHCLWPETRARSMTLEAAADVVVDVDAEGRPQGGEVQKGPGDPALDAAVLACAMQGRYRAAWNGAGKTCPVTVKLARYPSDVARRRDLRIPGECSSIHHGYEPLTGVAPGLECSPMPRLQ